jgi:hypothetical protein
MGGLVKLHRANDGGLKFRSGGRPSTFSEGNLSQGRSWYVR